MDQLCQAGTPRAWEACFCQGIQGAQDQAPQALRAPAYGSWRVQAALGYQHSPAIKQMDVCCNKVAQTVTTFYHSPTGYEHLFAFALCCYEIVMAAKVMFVSTLRQI